jgi:hypothetical protein
MKTSRIVVDELIEALRSRPESFTAGEHTLDDKNTGLSFWIANGRFCAGVYHPFKMNFGAWQSMRFHRELRNWKAWYTAKKLRGGSK